MKRRASKGPTPLQLKYAALGFTLSQRGDVFSRGLIEAHCEHGVGHPIPESIAAMESQTRQSGWGIHGCCGCCARFPTEPDAAA
jgi:hypothetical protein